MIRATHNYRVPIEWSLSYPINNSSSSALMKRIHSSGASLALDRMRAQFHMAIDPRYPW